MIRQFKLGDRVRFTQEAVDRGYDAGWYGTIVDLERHAPPDHDYEIVHMPEDIDDGLLGVVVNNEAGDLLFAGGACHIEPDDGPRLVAVCTDHDRGDEG